MLLLAACSQDEMLQVNHDGDEIRFNAVANNAPALTTIKPEMGVVQSSYDKWVTEENTGTTLIFDRVYLPNGMWNTLITTTDSIINGQVSSEDAAQQMETSFISLYRRKS